MNTIVIHKQNLAEENLTGKIRRFRSMDKKQLKEALHRQIDGLEDEMALQMLHEAATEYS